MAFIDACCIIRHILTVCETADRRVVLRTLEGFIVLEGLDGAGTTTQLKLLERRLKSEGVPFYCTYEPTRGIIGNIIWDVLKGRRSVHPYTLALLFAADRKEHLEEPEKGIESRVRRGELVISDRYLFSSLAYQGVENEFHKVLALNEEFPLPSHLFFIDTPPELCEQRIHKRRRKDLFDRFTFQKRVLEGYLKAFDYFSTSDMVVHMVDGTLPPKNIAGSIWNDLLDMPIFKL